MSLATKYMLDEVRDALNLPPKHFLTPWRNSDLNNPLILTKTFKNHYLIHQLLCYFKMESNMKTSRVSRTVISTIYKNISPKSVSILSRLLYRPSIAERRCNRGIHIGNSGNWTNYGNGWQHLESIVLQNPYDR